MKKALSILSNILLTVGMLSTIFGACIADDPTPIEITMSFIIPGLVVLVIGEAIKFSTGEWS